ncbi:response regulator [Hyunsoonleella sp. 2307UL5-6]|uniref:response regulator n=1 Tax=Hyunsoonleella sp. 2307UL5-6 TaxID=3384768 RepID=UPI0039BC7C3A
MKYLNKPLFIFAFLTCTYLNSQNQKLDLFLDSSNKTAAEILPEISKDSTKAELSNHVKAMIEWMTTEHYKSSYVQILIYADKGMYLAKKCGNSTYLGQARSIIGNTKLRVKDTSGAKKIFLKSLKEARKANDSIAILKSIGNLANVYYYMPGYKHKTIEKYFESMKIAKRLKDTMRLFIMHHNLSRLFNETNQPEKSKYQIQKTEIYLNEIGNPPHYKASHLHNQGRLHLLLNEPDKAIKKFKQTIVLCENTDFVDALVEGYQGYKEALEMKKDYKGIYEINKKLEVYENKKDKDEAKHVTDAVSAKLNVERYKDQIKAKELEKQLITQKSERKNFLLIGTILFGVFLIFLLSIIYASNKRKKLLVEDLQVRNKQYLIAKQESEQLAKSKSRFFATVSHELRTPLYGVIGLSSILLENVELKAHEKDLKSLKFSANYLLALINDLLQMNKIDNNRFTKEEIVFNLRDLINTISFSFEYIRLQHKNKINLLISDNVPKYLKGNSRMLSQILMNLIGNACKFTENGDIDVIINLDNIHEDIANIKFTIKDDGPGIEACKLKTIFDEFTQINSSTKTYQGTGLGLPIVKKLVSQAGSSIDIESKLGEGTTFKFALALKVASQFEENASSSIKDTSQLANKHILVVEDNRINQIVTKKILKTSNVNCDIADNGEEAVAKTKTQDYDLILMDINMPVKNGLEASKEIRTFNDKVPIVALTAVEIEEQKYQIFESGMNDIIVKPYDIDIFKQTILENLFTDKRKIFKKLG